MDAERAAGEPLENGSHLRLAALKPEVTEAAEQGHAAARHQAVTLLLAHAILQPHDRIVHVLLVVQRESEVHTVLRLLRERLAVQSRVHLAAVDVSRDSLRAAGLAGADGGLGLARTIGVVA